MHLEHFKPLKMLFVIEALYLIMADVKDLRLKEMFSSLRCGRTLSLLIRVILFKLKSSFFRL